MLYLCCHYYLKTKKNMKMKQFLNLMPLLLLASCSSELMDVAETKSNDNVEKVILRSKPFEYDDDTRTSLTATDKGISFAWAGYDALGVFPIYPETNNQAEQKLNVLDGADAHFATFDGAGWALNRKNTYAAYCPYNGKLPASTPYTAVPIDMTGQDGTLETIGKKYDYMYAPSSFVETTLSDGTPFEVVFNFKHAISIIQLKLTMPVAATWKSITLANPDGQKVWTTNATMNVADGTVTPTATSASINVALNNVVTTNNNKTITLYLAALPIWTQTVKLTAKSVDGTEYIATLASKNLVAGKAYRWAANAFPVFSYDGLENGYAYVDLGLSVKWATMNVGATNPQGYGNYYAWGETEPQSDNAYSWASYKWCNGTYYSMTKYCVSRSYGTVDNNTTLDSDDDAATVNWGGKWRMPTHVEQEELENNCYWVWTRSYNETGMNGYIIYKAKSLSDKGQVVTSGNTPSSSYSLSDSHIFLPAAGCRINGSLSDVRLHGYYWLSSLNESYSNDAWRLNFDSSYRDIKVIFNRCAGMSVRAVCER